MSALTHATALARLGLAAAATLLPCAPAGAQAPAAPAMPGPPARSVEARADEWMRKMSAVVAGAKTLSIEAEETFDAEFARAYRVSLTNVRTLTLERPSRFAASATGDTLHRASWYDGKSLTVLNQKHNVFASLEMPGTIDAVLDRLAADYDVLLPLSDLLYADPYAAMMEGVLYGKYLGIHQAGGVPCHHLSFGQEGVEWQIWIDAGAQPLPRKLSIAYWDLPGVPQYQALFRRITVGPKTSPELFTFKAPAGARKIDLGQLAALAAGAPER